MVKLVFMKQFELNFLTFRNLELLKLFYSPAYDVRFLFKSDIKRNKIFTFFIPFLKPLVLHESCESYAPMWNRFLFNPFFSFHSFNFSQNSTHFYSILFWEENILHFFCLNIQTILIIKIWMPNTLYSALPV